MLILLLITVTFALLPNSISSLIRSHHVQVIHGESTNWDEDITEDTTWYLADSPYILVQDIKVYTAALLTIEPGVIVKFANETELYVAGGLRAQGNITHPITFTSNYTTPALGIWDGVIFDGIKEFLIDYVLIEYANTGVKLVSVAGISNSMISNCHVGIEGKLSNAYNLTVTDNSGDGLRVSKSLVIKNSNASNNGGHGITITSTINMDNSIVSNNTKDGIILSSGGYIQNSLITGNNGNGTCILGQTTIENTTICDNGGDGIWAGSVMSIIGCNITRNERNGIKSNHVHEKTTITNSSISSNSGDGIWTDSSVEIRNCNITYNVGNGVTAAENGTMNVYLSNVRNNTLSGLSGSGYVFNSTVSGNKMCGVLGNFTIEVFSSITWNQGGGFNGTGSIDWSSIFNNKPYDAVADVWPNNITATNNWWGTDNGTLIEEHIWHHNDTESLGYVLYEPWLNIPPPLIDRVSPEIGEPIWAGTSPEPYISWIDFDYYPMVRMNEPVSVSVNVTDNESPMPSGVEKVFLLYEVLINQSAGEWWNTTMTLINETSGNWAIIIPAHQVPNRWTNVSVLFFIQAYDKDGNMARSPPLEAEEDYYSYKIKWLPIGDVNGDGKVRVDDVLKVALNFGEPRP